MSDRVEVTIERYGCSLSDAFLVVSVEGIGLGQISLRQLKIALDAVDMNHD